ncbi:MAG: Polysaccharide biosynthesis protein, partial [Parcubacteria group bacterium GW2011_GWC1_45_9]
MQGLKSFLFENKSIRQTVLKNTFWLTFGNIISRLIRAVLIIYAARVLGVAGYGVFSYALSLAGFFAIFADIGLTPLLTRESARNPEKRTAYLSTALGIKFIFMAISALLILFIAPLFAKLEGVQELFYIIVFLFAFDTLRDFFFGYTRSIEKMEIEAGVSIITNLAILVLGAGALFLAPSTKLLTMGYTAGSAVGLFAVIFVLRKYLREIFSSFRKELVKPILTEAWPFALAGLLGTIMLNTDMLMLGWLKGASDVGLYSAAQKIILLVYLVPGYLIVSLFPSLSRLANTDNERFRSIFEKAIKAMFLLAFPFAVGGILLAPRIISLVYGEAYSPAALAFTILLLTFFLVFPGTLISNAVFAYNKQKLFMWFIGLGAIANVIFNFLLIPPYGIF